MKHIQIGLPPELADALEHLGGRNEEAIGALVRDAVIRDLKQRNASRTFRMKNRFAPLRVTLEDDLQSASSWADLRNRLKHHGYRFARSGSHMCLENLDGERICNATQLGTSHAHLARRFGRPFPQPVVRQPLAS